MFEGITHMDEIKCGNLLSKLSRGELDEEVNLSDEARGYLYGE